MRHPLLSLIVGIATVALTTCAIVVRQTAAQPHVAGGAPGADSAATSGTTGKVVETMNAGGYTYVQVDDGSKKIWAAAPQFSVAVGNKVVVPNGMEMRDFYSKTLGRTFDVVYFVAGIQVVGGQVAKDPLAAHGQAGHGTAEHSKDGHGAASHGAAGASATPAAVDLSNIRKAEGGQTVTELFANKAALAGKQVVVRGRVVKFTPAVMGKNWMHVQDGTGSSGTNDLTVSTSATAAVGNLVLVSGKLGADKDFGAGYKYDVIIEDATVAVE